MARSTFFFNEIRLVRYVYSGVLSITSVPWTAVSLTMFLTERSTQGVYIARDSRSEFLFPRKGACRMFSFFGSASGKARVRYRVVRAMLPRKYLKISEACTILIRLILKARMLVYRVPSTESRISLPFLLNLRIPHSKKMPNPSSGKTFWAPSYDGHPRKPRGRSWGGRQTGVHERQTTAKGWKGREGKQLFSPLLYASFPAAVVSTRPSFPPASRSSPGSPRMTYGRLV